MLELSVLIGLLIIILITILYKNNYFNGNSLSKLNKPTEGFVSDNYYISSCPNGFNSYYDNNGNIMCCNGEVVANHCISDMKCSLTSYNNPDSCVNIIMEVYNEKAIEFCPMKSMTSYFEDGDKKGCTDGSLNTTLTGPLNSSQPKCTIYQSQTDNIMKLDSCYNQKKLNEAECFGNICSKSLIKQGENLPVLVTISFTDNNGMPHMAFTRKSYEEALNISNPNWREQGINLDRNIQVAEVAKAYYFDRTLQQSDIQF